MFVEDALVRDVFELNTVTSKIHVIYIIILLLYNESHNGRANTANRVAAAEKKTELSVLSGPDLSYPTLGYSTRDSLGGISRSVPSSLGR